MNAIAPGLILTDTIRAELPQQVIDHVKGLQVMDLEGEEPTRRTIVRLRSHAAVVLDGDSKN